MGMTKCHGVTAIVIGVLELVLGGGLIIASFVFASYVSNTSQTPYWGGFPFLITGAFGIAAGTTKNQCCMVTFLVLNIIMTIVTAAASIVVTVAMAFWNGISYSTTDCTTVGDKCVCSNGYSYETFDVKDCAYLDTITVALLAVLIFCYCCAGLAFAGSILGCAATCCAPPDAAPTVIIAQPPLGAPGVMVTHSSMQAAGYPPVGPYGQAMYPEQTVSTHDKAPLVV